MWNRYGITFVAGLVLAAGAAWGQTPAQPAPSKLAFEVASIRPAPPLNLEKLAEQMRAGRMPSFGAHVVGLRAEYQYMSLKSLIALAYGVKDYQVSGPAWLGTQRFDIIAKMPDGGTKDEAPAMLQTLLEQRFGLAVHRETQIHPVLALVVAKGGPKLKEAPPAKAFDENAPLKPGQMQMNTQDGPARMSRNPDGSSTIDMGAQGVMKISVQDQVMRMESSSVTMPGFADTLTNMLQQMGGGSGRQVVDKTGLKGSYQVAVEIPFSAFLQMARASGITMPPAAPPGAGAADSSAMPKAPEPGGVSIYDSVQALGLKLDPRKAPVEQLIVDQMEKTPTAN